jgi:hypothetical protein
MPVPRQKKYRKSARRTRRRVGTTRKAKSQRTKSRKVKKRKATRRPKINSYADSSGYSS